jgi:hypothetical protein
MKAVTPMISGGMNALRLPGFFTNLGHANICQTSGGGAYGHLDGPTAGPCPCARRPRPGPWVSIFWTTPGSTGTGQGLRLLPRGRRPAVSRLEGQASG